MALAKVSVGAFEKALTECVTKMSESASSSVRGVTLGYYLDGNHRALLEQSVDPSAYSSVDEFSRDYFVVEFLKKFSGLKTGYNLRDVAFENFKKFELQCEETNRNLLSRLHSTERTAAIFAAVCEKCRFILGLSPSYHFDAIIEEASWGNGSTSSCTGAEVSSYNKLRAQLEVTEDLYRSGLAEQLVRSIPGWALFHEGLPIENSRKDLSQGPQREPQFRIIGGNAVDTVPKNAKTDRTIAIEPHVNAFLQRGIGRIMRRLLLRRGFDLSTQDKNRLLACEGSKNGTFATIDLRGASDCVSQSVVDFVFPPEWVHLLNLARSHYYVIDGVQKPYHKHSSMGNGYTFELETILFYSVVLAVRDMHLAYGPQPVDDFVVYGDDIVIPTRWVTDVTDTLKALGFTLNNEKTFTYGPFRESCGEDYFLGVNVRPFFVRPERFEVGKKVYPFYHASQMFSLLNSIRRYKAFGRLSSEDRSAWEGFRYRILSHLGRGYDKFLGPDGYGDQWLVADEFEIAATLPLSYSRLHGWYYKTRRFIFRPLRKMKLDDNLSVVSALWHPSEGLSYLLSRGVGYTASRVTETYTRNLASLVEECADQPLDHTGYDLRYFGRWNEVSGIIPATFP